MSVSRIDLWVVFISISSIIYLVPVQSKIKIWGTVILDQRVTVLVVRAHLGIREYSAKNVFVYDCLCESVPRNQFA